MTAHWHVGIDHATFYVRGQPVMTLPARQYAILIADLAAALRAHLASHPPCERPEQVIRLAYERTTPETFT
jgi:hypothetical protein